MVLLLALAGCTVNAQPGKPPATDDAGQKPPVDTAAEGEIEEVARDSPRASIADFLARCRAGDYTAGASYLDLPRDRAAEGPELAQRLKAVLDRRAWVELESLSPEPGGNAEDGLPAFNDELGRIVGPEGVPEPIRIVRRRREGNVRWMFSLSTVSRIDGWYEKLQDRWLIEHLPARLLAMGPRNLMWWQWLALPLMIGAALLLGWGLGHLTTKVGSKITARSKATWDDLLVERMRRPVTLGWTLGAAYLLLPWLALYEPALEFMHMLLRTVFLIGIFWALARGVDIGAQMLVRSSWGVTHDASRSLVSLGSRVGKVAVLAIAAVALLSQLGYPVASILAGLGVGGLAVALAAQKTVENLFGAFSIGADQPFREGDFVRVDNFVATVELIGLRSTKFRTLDRTLISIPNGKVAEMKLETFAVRDRLRFYMIIGVDPRSTSKQLRIIIEGIGKALRAHPKLWQDSASVRFEKFGASSLDFEVSGYFDTRDWAEFTLIRQELLLEFMAIIESAGTSLALPTNLELVEPSARVRGALTDLSLGMAPPEPPEEPRT